MRLKPFVRLSRFREACVEVWKLFWRTQIKVIDNERCWVLAHFAARDKAYGGQAGESVRSNCLYIPEELKRHKYCQSDLVYRFEEDIFYTQNQDIQG